ncbi:hypothetical protein VC83_02422 [Pseudogymnoascus destructans]|uniref:Uncharacterized protein n=1 Tax=Pseudogymnoascus destructans TaxID=655981 RepID=A0A177AIE7_9PEZI|nr:uncharacterized protein VC83_02422 [Pseudogymnoascus destructans]OAF61023.1 hypothetical protein VC83_02422 [Pseudogymnoascus destructans]
MTPISSPAPAVFTFSKRQPSRSPPPNRRATLPPPSPLKIVLRSIHSSKPWHVPSPELARWDYSGGGCRSIHRTETGAGELFPRSAAAQSRGREDPISPASSGIRRGDVRDGGR